MLMEAPLCVAIGARVIDASGTSQGPKHAGPRHPVSDCCWSLLEVGEVTYECPKVP